MTTRFKAVINTLVRAYLRGFPVTEGKKRLLDWTRNFILPEESLVVFSTKHGFKLRANLRNPEHQRMYFYGEHDERYEINNIVRLLREGDICWDIGANVGFYTCLFASLVKPGGHVVAFEPVPSTRAFLEENIRLNGFQNVTVKNLALGDVPGKRQIFLNHPELAEGTVSLKSSGGAHAEKIVLDTVDNLYPGLPSPDFIKIDVEGYQTEVLNGAKKFFTQFSPMVMAELGDKNQATMDETQKFFHSRGYRIYEFKKFSLKPCRDILESRGRNFFMVKEDSPYFARILTRTSQ